METLISKTIITSLFVVSLSALIAAFMGLSDFPLSILLGGAAGIINLRGMSWGVEALLKGFKPDATVVLFSTFRLTLLALFLIILLKAEMIHMVPFTFGFIVVLIVLLFQGLVLSKNEVI